MQIGNVIFENPKTWSDTLIYWNCSDSTGFQGFSLNSQAKVAVTFPCFFVPRWIILLYMFLFAHIWFSLRWGFEQLICFSWPSCWDHYSHCLQEIRQRIAARAEGVLRDLGRSCWWNHIFVNLHHRRSCHISKYPSWYFLQKGVINISISKSNWNTNFTAIMTLSFEYANVEMIVFVWHYVV